MHARIQRKRAQRIRRQLQAVCTAALLAACQSPETGDLGPAHDLTPIGSNGICVHGPEAVTCWDDARERVLSTLPAAATHIAMLHDETFCWLEDGAMQCNGEAQPLFDTATFIDACAAGGGLRLCALDETGSVTCADDGYVPATFPDDPIQRIRCDRNRREVCSVTRSGSYACWDRNGQLHDYRVPTSEPIVDICPSRVPCAITASNQLHCWNHEGDASWPTDLPVSRMACAEAAETCWTHADRVFCRNGVHSNIAHELPGRWVWMQSTLGVDKCGIDRAGRATCGPLLDEARPYNAHDLPR